MGRTWCRADPLLQVGGHPVHLEVIADAEILGEVTDVQFHIQVPKGMTFDIPPGQSKKEIFDVIPSYTTELDQLLFAVSIKVTTEDMVSPVRLSVTPKSDDLETLYGEGETGDWVEALPIYV